MYALQKYIVFRSQYINVVLGIVVLQASIVDRVFVLQASIQASIYRSNSTVWRSAVVPIEFPLAHR